MTPTITALALIIGWAAGAVLAGWLCSWCVTFIRTTTRARARGWGAAIALVLPGVLAFGAAAGICALMVFRYGWQLAVIVWPHLSEILQPF